VSIIFGDFVLANNIAGNSYQNIQVYLFRKMSVSSGLSSAIVVLVFLVVLLFTSIILWIYRLRMKKEIFEMAYLNIEQVHKSYGKQKVLENISIQVEKGSIRNLAWTIRAVENQHS
jgi:cbb3-type cytochrome oxidase subunit 3